MTEEVGIKLVGKEWFNSLREVLFSPEFEALGRFLNSERQKHIVYPAKEDVFKAFIETPFDKVRVIVLGQDPYNTNNSATGLAFANPIGCKKVQPSLKNVLEEVVADVYEGFHPGLESDITLTHWAHQGVLLLNTALTIIEGKPNSHSKEWQFFTNHVITVLNTKQSGLIWLLWGNNAKEYFSMIDEKYHTILTAGHPASGCYGRDLFSGCKHFSKVNEILEKLNGKDAIIKW